MVVGTLELQLTLDGCFNLKEKRRILRSLIDRARHDHHVSIAEIEDQDLWNRSVIGVACVSSDTGIVESVLSRVQELFDSHPELAVDAVDRHIERT